MWQQTQKLAETILGGNDFHLSECGLVNALLFASAVVNTV